MPRVLLFDTNIWSDWLLGNEAEQQRVLARLTSLRATYGDYATATSRICIAEALVAVRRHESEAQREEDEARLWSEFRRPGLKVVELTDAVWGTTIDISDHAATLRAEAIRRTRANASAGPDGGKLKLPDAIVAASCFFFSPPAVLLTKNVKDFMVSDGVGGQIDLPGLVMEAL